MIKEMYDKFYLIFMSVWGYGVIAVIYALLFVFVLGNPFPLHSTKDYFSLFFVILIGIICPMGVETARTIFTKIQEEESYLKTINKNTLAKTKELQKSDASDTSKTLDISNLTTIEGLSNNKLTARHDLVIYRIFNDIMREAKNHRVIFKNQLITPYKEEFFTQSIPIQLTQKSALQVGILGTFVGFLLAISNLQTIIPKAEEVKQATDSNLLAQITNLSDALSISFGSSVLGLVTALILAMYVAGLWQKQKQCFLAIEKCTDNLIDLAYEIANRGDAIATLEDAREDMQALNSRITTQTEEIKKGMVSLAAAKGDLDAFLKDMKESNDDFVVEMKKVYVALSPKAIGEQVQLGLHGATSQIAETFKNLLEQGSKTNRTLTNRLIEATQVQIDNLGKVNSSSVSNMEELTKTTLNSIQTINQEMTGQLEALNTGIQNAHNATLKDSMKRLTDLNETIASLNTAINDAKQQLETGNKNVVQVQGDIVDIQEQAESAKLAAKQAQKQLLDELQGLPTAMQHDINHSIQNAGQDISTKIQDNLARLERLNKEIETLNQRINEMNKARSKKRFGFFSWF